MKDEEIFFTDEALVFKTGRYWNGVFKDILNPSSGVKHKTADELGSRFFEYSDFLFADAFVTKLKSKSHGPDTTIGQGEVTVLPPRISDKITMTDLPLVEDVEDD